MTPLLLVLIILGGAIGAWYIFFCACRDHERASRRLNERQYLALRKRLGSNLRRQGVDAE